MGHTLGTCGALEAWMTLGMQRENWVAPTLNLENVDSRCAALDYVRGAARPLRAEYVMTNNFAFGGINLRDPLIYVTPWLPYSYRS